MKHSYHLFIGFIALLLCLSSCRDDNETSELNNQLNINAYITYTDVKGIYEKGVPLDESNYIELHLNVFEEGDYNFSTTEINGYQFKGSGSLNGLGDQTINLYGEGIPQQKQVDSLSIETDSSSVKFGINIAENLSNKVIITTAAGLTTWEEYKVMAINGRGEVLWEFPGKGRTNFVHQEIVYLGVDNLIIAIKMMTGDILWQQDILIDDFVSHVNYADGKVYVGTNQSDFYILDSNNGQILEEFISEKYSNSHSSTLIHEDKVIFAAGNDSIFMRDKNTLELIWEKSYQNSGYPTIYNDYIIFSHYNGVFALNFSNGEIAWESDFISYYGVGIDGNNLIVNTNQDKIVKIDPNTGNLIWDANMSNLVYPPEIYGNYVLTTKNFGFDAIHCFNITSGEKIWEVSPFSFAQTELVAHENIVFLGTSHAFYGYNIESGIKEIQIGDINQQSHPLTLSYGPLLSITNIENQKTAYPGSIARD